MKRINALWMGVVLPMMAAAQTVTSPNGNVAVTFSLTGNWFVGGKTDAQARTSVVKLDFLDKGRKYDCAIYQDATDADYKKNPKAYQIVHKTVKKGDVIKVKEARGGGFAISLLAK